MLLNISYCGHESYGVLMCALSSFRCVILNAKEAEDKYILAVHNKRHVDLIKKLSSITDAKRHKIARGFNSIYLNEGSSEAAYLAAGSVIEVSFGLVFVSNKLRELIGILSFYPFLLSLEIYFCF